MAKELCLRAVVNMEFSVLYENHPDLYDQLVGYEDYAGNLERMLTSLLQEKSILLDCGAGTGRMTRILKGLTLQPFVYDLSFPMLRQLRSVCQGEISILQASHLQLPFRENQFDGILAGWTLCHLVDLDPTGWKDKIDQVISRLLKLLRNKGTIIIVETLGTGHSEPNPPDHLLAYQEHLESFWGLHRHCLRTDYMFPDLKIATELTEFFFGESMIEFLQPGPYISLAECTGLWSLTR